MHHLVGRTFVHPNVSRCKLISGNASWGAGNPTIGRQLRSELQKAIVNGQRMCAATSSVCGVVQVEGVPEFNAPGYERRIALSPLADTFEQRTSHLSKTRQRPRSKARPLRIAVHIRRGDLFWYLNKWNQPNTEKQRQAALMRLVPNHVYSSLIKSVAEHALRAGWTGNTTVTFHCEGSIPPASVLDVDGGYTNYSSLLQSADWLGAGRMHAALGSAVARDAFESMCKSDVLIGGGSGFSSLVGSFCSRPLKLLIPWTLKGCPRANTYKLTNNATANYRVKNSKIPLTLVSQWLPPGELGQLVAAVLARLNASGAA